MLKQRNAYPEVGSYSLYAGEGPSTPVRIMNLLGGGLVQVSFVERPEASGYRTLRLSALPNCDDLTEAERDEMERLSDSLHGRARPSRAGKARAAFDAAADRHDELRQRMIRAPILERLLDEQAKREKARRTPLQFVRTSGSAWA